jgi:hypothetical protein
MEEKIVDDIIPKIFTNKGYESLRHMVTPENKSAQEI